MAKQLTIAIGLLAMALVQFANADNNGFYKVEFNKNGIRNSTANNQNAPIVLNPDELITAINAIRSREQRCGNTRYRPAPPLRWHTALATAAQAHASDMALHNYFEHSDKNGKNADYRAIVAGYPTDIAGKAFVGENLGAGYRSTQRALQGWLNSTAHCENLMNPDYTDVGVGYAFNAKSRHQRYWAMSLGAVIPAKIVYVR